MQDTIFQEKKIAVIETVDCLYDAFSMCAHCAQLDAVLSFFASEFHLRDKLIVLHNLWCALKDVTPETLETLKTPELLNALSDVSDWTTYYNIMFDELNRVVANAKFTRIDSTDHIEDFRLLCKHTRHTRATTDHTLKAEPPAPEPKSTFDFIMEKVNRLSDAEQREFLNVKQGRPLPDFVLAWRNEMPYDVSDKTFSNCLSLVRNSFRKENKRSKRRK